MLLNIILISYLLGTYNFMTEHIMDIVLVIRYILSYIRAHQRTYIYP